MLSYDALVIVFYHNRKVAETHVLSSVLHNMDFWNLELVFLSRLSQTSITSLNSQRLATTQKEPQHANAFIFKHQ